MTNSGPHVFIDYEPDYDRHRRITKIRNWTSNNANAVDEELAVYEYAYDDAGNRLSHVGDWGRPGVGTAADDRTVAYNYDRLHRVTRADYDVPADVSTIFNSSRNGAFRNGDESRFGSRFDPPKDTRVVTRRKLPERRRKACQIRTYMQNQLVA